LVWLSSLLNSLALRNSPAAWATCRWDEYTNSYTFSQSLSARICSLNLKHKSALRCLLVEQVH
jgi:hypothetical protein